MEKVASHINEMQKIYEDYGAVFDQLVAEQSGAEKEVQLQENTSGLSLHLTGCSIIICHSLPFLSQVTEISMGQFLIHSSVIWLNPFPSLGRMKKDPELNVFGEALIFSHETIFLNKAYFICQIYFVTTLHTELFIDL